MVEWLLSWGEHHGLETKSQEVLPGRSNVMFHLPNGGGPHLLLNGHTDTVAVGDMAIPPFEADIHDGRLWGRGSADMKGPLACMLHTLIRLKEKPETWRGRVTLACVVDEELGFAGIRHFLAEDKTFDYAIVGEPTRFEVIRGCKGCLRFSFRAHGKAAHSSTPEKGVSAIHAMARAVIALGKYFADDLSKIRHVDLGRSTGSIGLIQGGTGINIVPEVCEIKVDVRLVRGESWQDIYAAIQQRVKASSSEVRWEFDADPMTDSPFCLDAGHELVTKACAAVGAHGSSVVNFSCDASKIAAAGIPCLIFGPGDIAEAHTAYESVCLSDLERGVEAYLRITRKLLSP